MTGIYVLILFAQVGLLGKGDAVSIASVPGFKTAQLCELAGAAAVSIEGSTTRISFRCMPQQ